MGQVLTTQVLTKKEAAAIASSQKTYEECISSCTMAVIASGTLP
jgi:hypothetical protein